MPLRVYSASQISYYYGSSGSDADSSGHTCSQYGSSRCAACQENGWVRYCYYVDLRRNFKTDQARWNTEQSNLISQRDAVRRKMDELLKLQSETDRDNRKAKREITRLEADLRRKEEERSNADARKNTAIQQMDQMNLDLAMERETEKRRREKLRLERDNARQEVERLKAELRKRETEEKTKTNARNSDSIRISNQNHEVESLRAYESERRKVVAAHNELEATKAMLASAEKQHEETKQLLAAKVEEIHGMQAFTTTADKVSVGDVVHLVHLLNADIHQTAAVIADSLRRPSSAEEQVSREDLSSAKRQAEINGLGQILADAIRNLRISRRKQGYNPTVVQYALQVTMTGFCERVINEWNLSQQVHDWLESIYEAIQTKEGQAVAGRWRALTRAQINSAKDLDTIIEVLAERLINILIMAGCSSAQAQIDDFRKSFEDRLSTIANLIIHIQTAVGEEITSVDVKTYSSPPGAGFSMESMEDMYNEGGPNDIGKPIAGTTELGIVTKDRGGERQIGVHYRDVPVVKTKIVLADVL